MKKQKKDPYTNIKEYRLSYTNKAEEILNSLSLEEKISLMSGAMTQEEVRGAIQKKVKLHYNEKPYRAGGIEEKGIPPLLFVDGTRGVVCGRGQSTCFPVSVMRGATFDVALEEKIGEAIGEEVCWAGGSLFGGVCVNLPYHPGWGRSQESYGEDPCLLGEMGAALIKGVQKKGVIACVKHFAFNSMENSRFEVDISCSKRAEREVYLPHFKKCIDAGAGALMSAYNKYDGVMCGHHHYLLNEVLKNEWGFDGFVMTDFNWGVKDTVAAITGGQDLEMPNTHFYGQNLIDAVKDKRVSEKYIDESALRIIRTLLAYQNRLQKCRQEGDRKEHDKKEHIALALQCAREGITLLRNQNHILPIRGGKARGRIVVLGRRADKETTGDKGSSQVYAPYVVTFLKGIQKAAAGAEIIHYAGDNIPHCKQLAKDADVVIVVVGNDYHDEGEYVASDEDNIYTTHLGGDRQQGLSLREKDLELLHAVSSIRKDAVVVLTGGGMLTMSDWEEETGAIVFAFYPGMEGGTALGEILFGKVNPSGKLPFVVAHEESDLPQINWNTQEQTYEYYHGYTLLDKKKIPALYPFGFGLSYTIFKMDDLKAWKEKDRLCATVSVTNTGTRTGTEVVQMYVGAQGSCVDRPKKVLKAFERVKLKKGEKKEVMLSCDMEDLAYYDEENERYVIEAVKYEVYVGNSSALCELLKMIV